MTKTFETNPIGNGTPCYVLGNHERKGVVMGRFGDCYVVKLEKPYVFGRKYRTIIDTILVHPDNVSAWPIPLMDAQ